MRPLLILLLVSFAGCRTADEPDQAQHLPTVPMQIGSKQFTLEVADTPRTQEIGLMYRDEMPADHGMIFVFPDSQVRQFWMKNTHIPLDIVFLAPDARVVSVRSMQPFDLRTTSSDSPAEYAVELNVGTAADAGVKVGDQLTIPPLPHAAAATTQSR